MANEFKVRKGLIVQGSGSAILDIFGSQGELFSVTDSLSGSLFSVNDISGIPIMEVFSDNTIKLGTYNQEAIIISGSRTGMGTALPQAELHISGANNDSLFRIQSPASSSILFVSGSGNVGIGTLTPTQKVSVDNGNVGFTSGFGLSWDSNTEWIRRATGSDQLQFATQDTVRLNIGSTQGQLVTIGLGATIGSAQFQVRGGGATSATTAMRIEDSGGTARLTILDDGTSAFNTSHFYISSSGRVGIGTTLPTASLHISGASNSNLLQVQSPAQTNIFVISGSGNVGIGTATPLQRLHVGGNITLSSNTFVDWANGDCRITGGSATGYSLQFSTYTGAALTEKMRISGSGEVGIGVTVPTARLHVSGASNAVLFEIDSPAVNNIMYVSGSGNVGIGTGTPTNTLQVVGGVTATSFTGSLLGTASLATTALTASFLSTGTYNITSSWAQSASNAVNAQTASFLNGAFLQNGNSFGTTALLGTNDNQNLQFETNGTVRMHISSSGNVGIGTTSPAFRLDVSGSSKFGTGSVGFASGLGQVHAVDRTGAYISATQTSSSIVTFMGADSNGGIIGTYSNHNLLIRTNNSNKITVEPNNIGIQTAPSEWIHLSSDPASSKYILIDATQNGNSPPLTTASTAKNGYGIVINDNYLAEPDYWMEIKLGAAGGGLVLIPCYLPE